MGSNTRENDVKKEKCALKSLITDFLHNRLKKFCNKNGFAVLNDIDL